MEEELIILQRTLLRVVTPHLQRALDAQFGQTASLLLQVALNELTYQNLSTHDLQRFRNHENLEDAANSWLTESLVEAVQGVLNSERVLHGDIVAKIQMGRLNPGDDAFEEFRNQCHVRFSQKYPPRERYFIGEDRERITQQTEEFADQLSEIRVFFNTEREKNWCGEKRFIIPKDLVGRCWDYFEKSLNRFKPEKAHIDTWLKNRFEIKLKDALRFVRDRLESIDANCDGVNIDAINTILDPSEVCGGGERGTFDSETGIELPPQNPEIFLRFGIKTDEGRQEERFDFARAIQEELSKIFTRETSGAIREETIERYRQVLTLGSLWAASYINPEFYLCVVFEEIPELGKRKKIEDRITYLHDRFWCLEAGSIPWNPVDGSENAVAHLVEAWVTMTAESNDREQIKLGLENAARNPELHGNLEREPVDEQEAAILVAALAGSLRAFALMDRLRNDFKEAQQVFQEESERLSKATREQTDNFEELAKLTLGPGDSVILQTGARIIGPGDAINRGLLTVREVREAKQQGQQWWQNSRVNRNQNEINAEELAVNELRRRLAVLIEDQTIADRLDDWSEIRRLERSIFDIEVKSKPIEAINSEIQNIQRTLINRRPRPESLIRYEWRLKVSLAAIRWERSKRALEDLKREDGNINRFKTMRSYRNREGDPPRADSLWVRSIAGIRETGPYPNLTQPTISRRLDVFRRWFGEAVDTVSRRKAEDNNRCRAEERVW